MDARRNYSTSLTRLLKGIWHVPAVLDTQIHGIRTDSRMVEKGDLFLALARDVEQAQAHIHEAVARGAIAVIGDASVNDRPVTEEAAAVEIFLHDLRSLMGTIADRFFQRPSQDVKVIGITGTNGKTSVSHYIAECLSGEGELCGIMGTLGYGIPALDGHDLKDTGFTTPDVVAVHRSLASLRDRGASYVAMEVSSHGIEQGRVTGVQFYGAVFTNLSREHLDYHGTMENYGAVKRRLFQSPGLRFAVLNGDDAYSAEILPVIAKDVQVMRYGFDAGNEVRALDVRFDEGISAHIHTPIGEVDVRSKLLGEFNLSNLMAVTSVAVCLGRALASLDMISALQAVTGRMQLIRREGCPLAVVDFAHTPDALEKVLQSLRRHCRGKQVVVFGCGGDRDRGKRPEMAKIAERLADEVWVTSDNPRSEKPEAVVDEILLGFSERSRVHIQVDRALAIRSALESAAEGDLVLVAGKGHETWQEANGERTYFSDVEQVQQVLQSLAFRSGESK